MIQFKDFILNTPQFKNLLASKNGLNQSYLIESNDEVFYLNFAYCLASQMLCSTSNFCGQCSNCKKVELLSHPDLTFIPQDKSKNIGVDDIKFLIDNTMLAPMEADCKVYILCNFQSATIASQNKLLKTLEEPQKNTYFIILAENINSVLPTIQSRCEKIKLDALSPNQIEELLKILNQNIPNLSVISQASGGSLTWALNFLQNNNFLDVYYLMLSVLQNLKSSADTLKFSSKIMAVKDYFPLCLDLLIHLLRDVLMIRLNKQNLVLNQAVLPQLKDIALTFNASAIALITKDILQIKKQIIFNCSVQSLIDKLLFKILEDKYKCNN